MLQDVLSRIVKPSRRRPVVEYLCGGYGVNERRACHLARLARSTRRYRSRKDAQTALRQRIREIVRTQFRYGYRKIRVLLNREGWNVGKKRVYWLYREEGLTLRQRPRHRRRVAARSDRGTPQMLFCDKGTKFTSQVMDLWAYQNGVRIDFSRPGKPTDNAYVESFNGTFRAECLDAHWFHNLTEAKQLIEA